MNGIQNLDQFNNPIEPDKKEEGYNIVLGVAMYIVSCAWRGFTFTLKDIPVWAWQKKSGKVDQAYQGTKGAIEGNKAKQAEKNSFLNMDINDLLKNSKMMQQKIANLEKDKLNLLENLKGEGGIRGDTPSIYKFTAKNPKGKIETGVMSGYSKLDIYTFLSQDGYDVYKIESDSKIDFLYGESSLFAPKLSTKDLLFWLTQLSTYIKAGLTLSESIKILNHQMNKKPMYKRAFQSIVFELTSGEDFSAALEKQGTMFPPLLINMIKAAEATGEIQETLDDMANYYDEVEKTRKAMVSAMTYPAIILIFSLAVVTFVLVWVIPNFVGIYESAGAPVEGLTLFVLNLSEFLQANVFKLVLLAAIAIGIIYFCYKKIKVFRKKMQKFLMKIPTIGNVFIYNEIAIFAKTFSSLLRNNVFITDSIDILSKITHNEIYKDIMYNTINNIIKGDKISLSFKDHWAVPEVAYFMIVTGESTGELAEMMTKVSNYYQEMHRNMVGAMKSFIEPITICFLAVVVGGIILAVIVPMFNLMNTIQV